MHSDPGNAAGDNGAATLANLLDLARYPLQQQAARQSLVAQCRAQLAAESCVTLPGFVPRAVAQKMAEEAARVVPQAHRRERSLSAYANNPASDDVAADHPTKQLFPFRQHVVATDLLPAEGLIMSLYRQDALTTLVADVLDQAPLYRTADELLSCTVTAMHAGDEHGWHFDSNDFVVSLLLQAPERGGAFEFAPYVRGESDEKFADVVSVMLGNSDRLRVKPVDVGTLMIFCGRRSLHRVSRIEGASSRLIALFCYDRRPQMQFSDSARSRAVGRTQSITEKHAQR
jgi:hypothetical protein